MFNVQNFKFRSQSEKDTLLSHWNTESWSSNYMGTLISNNFDYLISVGLVCVFIALIQEMFCGDRDHVSKNVSNSVVLIGSYYCTDQFLQSAH